MTSNYDGYALLKQDDPEQECLEWFWVSLNEDDVYPKEFLEELMQMIDDVESGKTEVTPLDNNLVDKLEELLKEIDKND